MSTFGADIFDDDTPGPQGSAAETDKGGSAAEPTERAGDAAAEAGPTPHAEAEAEAEAPAAPAKKKRARRKASRRKPEDANEGADHERADHERDGHDQPGASEPAEEDAPAHAIDDRPAADAAEAKADDDGDDDGDGDGAGEREPRARRRRKRSGRRGRDRDDAPGAEDDGPARDADAERSADGEDPDDDLRGDDGEDDETERGDDGRDARGDRGDEGDGDREGRRKRKRRRRKGGSEDNEQREQRRDARQKDRQRERDRNQPALPDDLARWAPDGHQPAVQGRSLGQRVAVFVHLDSLLSTAESDSEAEVSYRRLLRSLAGSRPIVRAVCYGTGSNATQRLARAAGFELAQDGLGGLIGLAVDAMAVAPKVDCVVVCPATPELQPLMSALRGQGVRVETADFRASADDAQGPELHTRLGRECLFTP